MWVRGLKQERGLVVFQSRSVAPYVGAWIETREKRQLKSKVLSHPMWVRGLKLPKTAQNPCKLPVAPYVGAWIETPP